MRVYDEIASLSQWIFERARTYYSHKADAEDLAGETIYKCLKNADRFDGRRDLKPWIWTIMHNTFLQQYRKRKNFHHDNIGLVMNLPSPMRADDLVEFHETLSILRALCRTSLSVACAVLYMKGYSYAEISQRQRIPIGTVQSRIHNARAMIRKALGC